MDNPVLNPEDLNHLLQSLNNLRDLTLRRYRFSCICYTSVLVDKCFGNCNTAAMKSISELPNLKTLRLFSISAHQLQGLKHFPKLLVLKLTVPSFDYELISCLSEACIQICLTRGLNPNSIAFRVRSDEKFTENLKSFIVSHYEKVANNLRLFVKDYRQKRIN